MDENALYTHKLKVLVDYIGWNNPVRLKSQLYDNHSTVCFIKNKVIEYDEYELSLGNLKFHEKDYHEFYYDYYKVHLSVFCSGFLSLQAEDFEVIKDLFDNDEELIEMYEKAKIHYEMNKDLKINKIKKRMKI